MLVKDVMRRPFVVDKDIILQEAAKIMSSKNIGCLVFVSGKKIKGIISERDLMKHFDSGENISDIMTKKVISIGQDEDLEKALELMNRNKIKKLPVVKGDELVGIITATDLLSNADELEGDFFFN